MTLTHEQISQMSNDSLNRTIATAHGFTNIVPFYTTNGNDALALLCEMPTPITFWEDGLDRIDKTGDGNWYGHANTVPSICRAICIAWLTWTQEAGDASAT